jgi:hypothetical protein
LMRVTGRLVEVEVVCGLPASDGKVNGCRPGWAVRSMESGRLLEVRSPARFRGRVVGDRAWCAACGREMDRRCGGEFYCAYYWDCSSYLAYGKAPEELP